MALSERDKAIIRDQQAKGLMPSDDQLYPKDPNNLHVKVTVDNDEIQQIKNRNDALEKEATEVKEVKAFFDAEKSKASERLSKLGIPTNSESIRTADDLQRINNTIDALSSKQVFGNEGGTPLSPFQTGEYQKQGTYANHEALISDLILKEKVGNKSEKIAAKQALDAMTLKVVRGAKEGKIPSFDFPKNESIIDKINESHRRKILAQRGNLQ